MQELRFAFRLFARQRAFFAAAALTIALGIGLTATVFAVGSRIARTVSCS